MRKVTWAFVASLSMLQIGFAEDEELYLDPFEIYEEAMQNTQLIDIEVSVYDVCDNRWQSNEEIFNHQLNQAICHKFLEHGLYADRYEHLTQQPQYQGYEEFFDAQYQQGATFTVSVYHKNYAVFVEIWCLKKGDQYPLGIYSSSFRVENDQDWQGNVEHLVLSHVEEFLQEFTQVHIGPYGWVLP